MSASEHLRCARPHIPFQTTPRPASLSSFTEEESRAWRDAATTAPAPAGSGRRLRARERPG